MVHSVRIMYTNIIYDTSATDITYNVYTYTALVLSYTTHIYIYISSVYQAYIPELGLTNKAVEHMSQTEKTEAETRNISRIGLWSKPLLGTV